MDKPIGEQSIREFVQNFTSNTLTRNLRTPVEKSDYNHYYGSDREFANKSSGDNNATSFVKIVDPWCQIESNSKIICVKELNTSSFQSFVMQKNKVCVLMEKKNFKNQKR
jgi:hypothetical protein